MSCRSHLVANRQKTGLWEAPQQDWLCSPWRQLAGKDSNLTVIHAHERKTPKDRDKIDGKLPAGLPLRSCPLTV